MTYLCLALAANSLAIWLNRDRFIAGILWFTLRVIIAWIIISLIWG